MPVRLTKAEIEILKIEKTLNLAFEYVNYLIDKIDRLRTSEKEEAILADGQQINS